MNIYHVMYRRYSAYMHQLYCYGVFFLTASILFGLSLVFSENQRALFHIIVITGGWMSWTFFEYILHRYWMHKMNPGNRKKDFANHQYHHTHPTEMRITNLHRTIMILGLMAFATLSYVLNNYFSFITGFYGGFVMYSWMHLMLHRKWATRLMPRLVDNHIYHHCKFPNRCFGVTTIVWDYVFGTEAPKSAKISDKVRSFYFGEDH